MVELGDKRAQFLKEGHTNQFQVRFACAFRHVRLSGRSDIADFPVEANRAWLCRDLPLGGAEENADMRRAKGRNPGRDRFGFERMLDCRENDGVARHVNEHSTPRKIGDDFVLLGK